MRFVLHMQERNTTGKSCGARVINWRNPNVQWGAGGRKRRNRFSDLLLVVDPVQYRPHRSLLLPLSKLERRSSLLSAQEP